MQCIYKITNLLSGKQYVGKTTQPLNERYSQHVANANNLDTYLYRAMRKYGIESFVAEIIEWVGIHDDIDAREKFWISELRTLAPSGYNMTVGGDGGDTSTSPQYMRGMASRRTYKGEHNPNYGKLGEASPNFGKRRNQDQRENMRAGILSAWNGNTDRLLKASTRMSGCNNPGYGKTPMNAVKVDFCGVIYDSLAEASRATGVSIYFIKKNGTLLHVQQT